MLRLQTFVCLVTIIAYSCLCRSEELITEKSEELITEKSEELITEKSEELNTEKSEELITEKSEEVITEKRQCSMDEHLIGRGDAPLCSIHANGVSAQAYKPNAPVKRNVCDLKQISPYKISSSMFLRSLAPHPAPVVNVKGRLVTRNSCSPSNTPFPKATVEVWQPRPNGVYSSLSPNNEEGDCRATILPEDDGSFEFSTLAPGSTGLMGGLGPGGFDLALYGPPVMHFLVSAPGYEIFLGQLIVSSDVKDFTGTSMTGADSGEGTMHGIDIISKEKISGGGIEIQIEINMQSIGEERHTNLNDALCQSRILGLPQAFFLEPIALCAPVILDFFPL